MLSLRLTPGLLAILETMSKQTGLSKNQILVKALEAFIEQNGLSNLEVKGPILEYNGRSSWQASSDVLQIVDWIHEKAVWSGIPCSSGNPRGALYGRNLISGYSLSPDGEACVISYNLSQVNSPGPSFYHRDVTLKSTWDTVMEKHELVRD